MVCIIEDNFQIQAPGGLYSEWLIIGGFFLCVSDLGYLFSTITCIRKKVRNHLRSSHVDGKRERACFHVETATDKREKWRENRGHVVIFAVGEPSEYLLLFFIKTWISP